MIGTEKNMRVNHSLPVLALTLLFCGSAAAQTFNSGSNGSDGALDLTGQTGTILFNPASFNPPLDPDHDNVYHFTTIKIPSGLTVRLLAANLGVKPVIWLASGAVEISGTLDLNGAAGHSVAGPVIPSVAGAGGYGGGTGATSIEGAKLGSGPGGGLGPGGGAGYATAGTGPNQSGGNAYGNSYLIPMIGGSGGAGGSYLSTGNPFGGGGGAGGGALLIASTVSITLPVGASILANGGNGTCNSGDLPPTQSSGGGSGGAIRLMAPSISGTALLRAIGGTSCHSGGTGSLGRIRLETFNLNLGGQINPAPTVATPGTVFPPASAPSVRITSIGGVAVPANPTASFITPDVTLDNATSVSIQLEAAKVPVGTVVRLTLTPETGTIVTVNSTPLAGTFESSTASATVTVPHGFSRFSVQASWTP